MMPLLLRFTCALSALTCVWALALSPQINSDKEPSVKFTIIAADSPHGASIEEWGAMSSPDSPRPNVTILRFLHFPLDVPSYGTAIASVLRNGNLIAVSTRGIASLDEFEVTPELAILRQPGKCASAGSCCVHSNPADGWTCYPAAPYITRIQALYKGGITPVGYVFSALVPNASGNFGDAQLWRVDLAGIPEASPLTVGNHGCALSPDGNFLACEPAIGDSCPGIRLRDTNETKSACIFFSQQHLDLTVRLPSWSSDSKGFAFYAHAQPSSKFSVPDAWVDYYTLGDNPFAVETQKLRVFRDQDFVPGDFCQDVNDARRCAQLGTLNSLSPATATSPIRIPVPLGTESLVWGARDPNHQFLYFSAFARNDNSDHIFRTIGRIDIKDSSPKFRPLLRHPKGPTAYSATSPDGKFIAFLGITSRPQDPNKNCGNFQTCELDARSQLYVVDTSGDHEDEGAPLTSLAAPYEVFNPVWSAN